MEPEYRERLSALVPVAIWAAGIAGTVLFLAGREGPVRAARYCVRVVSVTSVEQRGPFPGTYYELGLADGTSADSDGRYGEGDEFCREYVRRVNSKS